MVGHLNRYTPPYLHSKNRTPLERIQCAPISFPPLRSHDSPSSKAPKIDRYLGEIGAQAEIDRMLRVSSVER
jgi:hypothetical protein